MKFATKISISPRITIVRRADNFFPTGKAGCLGGGWKFFAVQRGRLENLGRLRPR